MTVDTSNPKLIVFLIDQSISMGTNFINNEKRSETVAQMVNDLISTLLSVSNKPIFDKKKMKSVDHFRNYFYVSLVGYGDRVTEIIPGLSSAVDKGEKFHSVANLSNNYLKKIPYAFVDEKGTLRQIEKKIFIEPRNDGKSTAMCAAFVRAESLCREWVESHPKAEAPLVFNITDGEARDGVPLLESKSIMNVKTFQSSTQIFNIHIKNSDSEIAFPDDEIDLPDENAINLFKMSSVASQTMIQIGRKKNGIEMTDKSRLFVYNATAELAILAMDIGTRSIIEQ